MLQIRTLALGLYQTNCYLLWSDENAQCLVIDPGYEAQTVLSYARSLGKQICAVLLTHGHFDHVGAVKEIAQETGCAVYLKTEDTAMPEQMTAGKLFYTHALSDGDVLALAGLSVCVMHTPGHTPGSVCFLIDNTIFSGDTLFACSCGRTDLPGGCWETLTRSLARLRDLNAPYDVYPGHGPCTTLDEEKQNNPYLR